MHFALGKVNWGIFGVYLFALTAFNSMALTQLAMAIMLVAFIAELFAGRFNFRQYPWALFMFLPFCYLSLRNLSIIADYPDLSDTLTDLSYDWIRLAFFVIVAWFIRGDQRRILRVLAFFFAGFILGMLSAENWEYIQRGNWQSRWGFGLAMIPFGHLCSVALLGVLLFAPRICGHFKNHWWWYTKVIGLIIAAGLLLQAMIISQTRASWLAAMLVLPVVLIFYLFPEIKSGDYRKKIASGALLTIVAVGILVSMNYQVISSRMAVANDELQSIVNNGHVGSVGARYYLWVYGLDKWAESPLVGWGNSAVVLKMPENSDIYQLTHLHNTYIEVMVQGGIIALGLFLTAIFIVARSLYSVHRRRLVSRDVCAFLAGTLAILLIWMFADYEVFLSRFRFFVVVMLGLMFSYYFVGASEKENKRTSAGTTGSIKES